MEHENKEEMEMELLDAFRSFNLVDTELTIAEAVASKLQTRLCKLICISKLLEFISIQAVTVLYYKIYLCFV